MEDVDDLYDDETWALITRWNAERVPFPPEVARGWRAGAGATAFLAAAALGVRDIVEPEQRTPLIEEIDLDTLGLGDDAPVVYHHVVGLPRASRAIVRPWLF